MRSGPYWSQRENEAHVGGKQGTREQSDDPQGVCNSCQWWVRTAGGVNVWAHSRALSSRFSRMSQRGGRSIGTNTTKASSKCRSVEALEATKRGVRGQYGSRGSHKALETSPLYRFGPSQMMISFLGSQHIRKPKAPD